VSGRLDPPPTTVVTGATGWLGTALLHALTADEGPWSRMGRVRAVVHRASEVLVAARISARIDPVVADITRPRSLTQVFADLEPGSFDVLHTAGIIHPPDVATFEQVNAGGTRNVLEAAREAGVRRFVHVSSNSPFGTNPLPSEYFRREEPYAPYLGYGASKMEAELIVRDSIDDGLDAVIVRPPWFYGPHQPARQTTFFTLVRTGRFPIVGDGRQRRSMVYVDHLVQGVVLAELVDHPARRAWWIADRDPYPLEHVVQTVGEALRAEGYEVAENSLRVPAFVGRFAEVADRMIQNSGRYVTQVHVLGEMDKTIAVDVSAAVDDLGYDPDVALSEGMRRSIRWCRSKGIDL
jgi:nucleoside-diphosphate-sugar epimerase